MERIDVTITIGFDVSDELAVRELAFAESRSFAANLKGFPSEEAKAALHDSLARLADRVGDDTGVALAEIVMHRLMMRLNQALNAELAPHAAMVSADLVEWVDEDDD